MDIIVIIGDSAVGKMTVGEELSKITGYRLMHNHLTIEPVIEMFGYYKFDVVTKIRKVMLEEFSKLPFDGLIMTMMINFDIDGEVKYIEELLDTIKCNKEVYYVELTASLETRLERNRTTHRLERKPSKRDVEESEYRILTESKMGRYESYEGELKFENYIKINTESKTAEEVAKEIVGYFEL